MQFSSDVLRTLVAIRSVADAPQALEQALGFCVDQFRDMPMVTRWYSCGGKPSVVIARTDALFYDTIFVGHVDVVPGDDALFVLREEGERLVGRGVCDMKGPIIAMINAMREVLRMNPSASVAMMLTSDEEIDGVCGARYLVDEIGYRANVVVVPDGGNDVQTIVTSNKASWTLRITAHGTSAHGARPWLGVNAIEKLMRCTQEVLTLFPARLQENKWENTCNVGRIEGGRASNQVPDSASCLLDVRLIETTNTKGILEELERVVAVYGCTLDVLETGIVSHTASDNPYLVRYASVVKSVTGVPVQFVRSEGADDGRFFSRHNIPVICTRPKSGGQHSDHEWVDAQSLQQLTEIFVQFCSSKI